MQNHKKNKSVPSASTNSRSIRMRQLENTNSFSMLTTSILVEEYRTYSISGETANPLPDQLIQEKTNGIFYLQPGLDIEYSKNINGGWDVFLYKPIKIYHDISTSGRWGGQVVLTIDKNWNMTLTFSTTDGWTYKNQDIYGRMTIETDLMNASDPEKNNLNITRYDVGTPNGRYYNIAPPGKNNVNITIRQTNTTTRVVDGRTVLNVRNLYDIIRVDAEFIGYYGLIKQNKMFIKFFDTVGIRVPSRIPYDSNKLTAPINPPSTISIVNSKRDDNLIVDISDYVTFETTTNGMIDVKIVTPLTIDQDISISEWRGRISTTIDKNWNIITTYKSEDAWPDADNYSNVLGDLRIEANINEENNINIADGNVVNVYKRRNMFSRYTQIPEFSMFNADNFIYLSKTTKPFTINHKLNYNKETLSFRNLDNLVRIYTDMVRYRGIKGTLNNKIQIKNTLTLMCKYKPPIIDNNDENKKAYFSVSKPPTLIKNLIQIDNLPLVFTNPPNSAVGYYDIDLDPQLNTYSPFYFYRYEPDISTTYNKITIDDVTNVSIKENQESIPVNVVDAIEIKNHVNLDNKNILRLKMLESVFQIKSCELIARCEPKNYIEYKTLSRIKLTWKILNAGMTIIIEPIENIIFFTTKDSNGNVTILQQYTY